MHYCAILLLLFLLLSCNSGEKVKALSDAETSAYQLCHAPQLPDGFELQVLLDTASEKALDFQLHFRNKTGKEQTLKLGEAMLISSGGYRAALESINANTITIAAGEGIRIEGSFSPVNDLYLYQRTRLSGPLGEQYKLPLSFIAGLKDTLLFCFPHKAYLAYRAEAIKVQPLLYKPVAAVQAPVRIQRQQEHWTSIADSAGSTHFTEQEFFTGGINIRHALYAQQAELVLDMQVINHSPRVLQLEPEKISMRTATVQQQPLSWKLAKETVQAEINPQFTIRQGDRLSLQLHFKLPAAADSVQLHFSGLTTAEKPVFAEGFWFSREQKRLP